MPRLLLPRNREEIRPAHTACATVRVLDAIPSRAPTGICHVSNRSLYRPFMVATPYPLAIVPVKNTSTSRSKLLAWNGEFWQKKEREEMACANQDEYTVDRGS